MDPFVGAGIAASAAWLSILAAVWAPVRLDARRVRIAAAATLGVIGLIAIGLPMPAWTPLVAILAGLAWAWSPARRA